MMERFAGDRGPAQAARWSRVPVLTPRLSSYWVALVTPVDLGLVRPLVEGLSAEMIVARAAARRASTTTRWASTTRCAPAAA